MSSFQMTNLSEYLPLPSETWGPSKIDFAHTFVPVEFVGRTEKLGRFCDFTAGGLRTRRGDGPEEFQFVDSRPLGSRTRKFAPRTAVPYQLGGRGRGKGGVQYARGGRGQWGAVRIDHRTGKPVALKMSSAGKHVHQRAQWQRGPSSIVKGIRDWSVSIKPEYNLLSEISLASLGRRKIDATKSEWLVSDGSKVQYEDLIRCGTLATYDKGYDKVTARGPKGLLKFEKTNFYNVSTGQDPVMEELITRAAPGIQSEQEKSVLVACTDQVLSVLMTANRSIYSWDLVITRNGNTILIDKRDAASSIDFVTVNENSQEPPSFDENIDPLQQINSPVKLGIEATAICQSFSQQVLLSTQQEPLEYPNPFHGEDEDEAGNEAAKTAYVYRKVYVPAGSREYNFIVRGEVNAATVHGEEEDKKYISIKALNEFDPKATNWKDSFERNRETAVLANELKNNSFKIAKWLASCAISNCHVLKLGFVTRRNEDDPWNHQILAVQSHSVPDLMAQVSMSTQSIWSSVCTVLDNIMNIESESVGRYLVVKDPSKPVLNLYAVPWDEFEQGDDDLEHEPEQDDDDEEEDPEEQQLE